VSSLLGVTEVDSDEPAWGSAPTVGAAKAERDDVEDDTASDARRSEELDGNLITYISSVGWRFPSRVTSKDRK
jgi:hypothetical protein